MHWRLYCVFQSVAVLQQWCKCCSREKNCSTFRHYFFTWKLVTTYVWVAQEKTVNSNLRETLVARNLPQRQVSVVWSSSVVLFVNNYPLSVMICSSDFHKSFARRMAMLLDSNSGPETCRTILLQTSSFIFKKDR